MSSGFSLDTSVALRLLMQAPVDQYLVANAFLKEQLEHGAIIQLPDLVLAEAYFALQTFYKMPKEKALEALALFTKHSGVSVSLAAENVLQLPNLSTAKLGFVDRLIHETSLANGQVLVTFEKAAKKLAQTTVL